MTKTHAEYFAEIVTMLSPSEVEEAMRKVDAAIAGTYLANGDSATATSLGTFLGWLQEVHYLSFYARPINKESEAGE